MKPCCNNNCNQGRDCPMRMAQEAGIKFPHKTNGDNPVHFPPEKNLLEKISERLKSLWNAWLPKS